MENDEIKIEIVNPHKKTAREIFDDVIFKAKETAKKAATWAVDHKDEVTALVITAVTVCAGIKKVAGKTAIEVERERISHTYYDPSTGLHWQLRRPMTNRERIELSQRKRDGELIEDILDDMRILR